MSARGNTEENQEQQGQRPSRFPGSWTLARDMLAFAGGWVITFMEIARPEVREAVLTFAGALIAVPGTLAGISSVAGAIRGGTGGSQSSPPPGDSSSSLP